MRELKPLKLHSLLAGQTSWTDQLWDEALQYVLANTATPDAESMAATLFGFERQSYWYKVDYLRDFREVPPTALLGAFDLMRYRKAQRVDQKAALHTVVIETWQFMK